MPPYTVSVREVGYSTPAIESSDHDSFDVALTIARMRESEWNGSSIGPAYRAEIYDASCGEMVYVCDAEGEADYREEGRAIN